MTVYVCPMHPEVRQDRPGTCPKCGGMRLVPEGDPGAPHHQEASEGFFATYRPLFVILGLILLPVAAVAWTQGQPWQEAMQNFMAGFFLVFSGMKLLDIPGFAEGYATYDILARRWKGYGYVYPFLELFLGLAYLTRFEPAFTNRFTLVLMAFSGAGVVMSLLQKRKFQCACLGTFIKVPLTKVTVIEDFGMAAMAAVMLLDLA